LVENNYFIMIVVLYCFIFFLGGEEMGGGRSNNTTVMYCLLLVVSDGYRFSSSSGPSSSDGATSSRLSSETTNNYRKSSRSSTGRYANGTATTQLLRAQEVSGIVGDLSEVPDCSVVDSEFVSEYCRDGLRVGAEVKRYSTASEDSGHNGGMVEEEGEGGGSGEEDCLAALSVESLSRHQQGYHVSSSDLDARSDGWADSDNVDGEEDGEGVEQGRIRLIAGDHFVNPLHNGEVSYTDDYEDDDEGNEDDGEEDDEVQVCMEGRNGVRIANLHNHHYHHHQQTQPLMPVRQTDSERVLIHNAVNKPKDITQPPPGGSRQAPSLTDVSPTWRRRQREAEAQELSPSHTSVPCLKFRAGMTEEVTAPDSVDRDTVNSLPNLNKNASCNGDAVHIVGPTSSGGGGGSGVSD
jgi:hypothetical protein